MGLIGIATLVRHLGGRGTGRQPVCRVVESDQPGGPFGVIPICEPNRDRNFLRLQPN